MASMKLEYLYWILPLVVHVIGTEFASSDEGTIAYSEHVTGSRNRLPEEQSDIIESSHLVQTSTLDTNQEEVDQSEPKTLPLSAKYDYDGKKYPNTEHLEIKPLQGGNILMSFNFEANRTTELYPSSKEITYYDVFPKALGSILKSTNTRELHLRFGHGWYDSDLNGKLVANGNLSGGTGVEIWAFIEANSEDEAFEYWVQLANSLSGLFCASFNSIDSAVTTKPEQLFQKESNIDTNSNLLGQLYHFRSALPREPICTENLTPFLKLLPTKGKQGISSLLSGNKMFNAEWTSMSIDILTNCEDGGVDNCTQSLKQAINLILNVPKVKDKNKYPIPKPTPGAELKCDPSRIHDLYNCFPLVESPDLDFTFLDLFGKVIRGGSLVASKPSTVCFDIDLNNWEIGHLSLQPPDQFYMDEKLCFSLLTSDEYNVSFKTHDSSKVNNIEQPPFQASRSLSGYSQESGGFRLDFFNPTEGDQVIVIFQALPWFVKLYTHSLVLTVTNKSGESVLLNVQNEELSEYIKEIVYHPAVDRVTPTHLELRILAPAKTKLKFTFSFDKSMLLYSEYPPDANHGFELEPVVFALIDKDHPDNVKYIMRTTTGLLTLPTPDFSMPYNVIILTLTIMSLTFGSIFNLLVKKVVTEEEAELAQSERPVEKLKQKFRTLFGRT